ncbi:MAG: hypothetical protein Satyrvirus28_2 [Satyrvirus sp.]|uniref:Uncharacterized protein n=1 Tax=Satyrvirus sp. TaxID=2487771 RepID=A0A3G5AGB8_9VIRU|nr:MAG: hypothetical protein Satyrvirus28_2 [Satyrvirus sp.]
MEGNQLFMFFWHSYALNANVFAAAKTSDDAKRFIIERCRKDVLRTLELYKKDPSNDFIDIEVPELKAPSSLASGYYRIRASTRDNEIQVLVDALVKVLIKELDEFDPMQFPVDEGNTFFL